MRWNPFRARYADGGVIAPYVPDDDSVLALLSPGYVSYDGGETWRECPDEETNP